MPVYEYSALDLKGKTVKGVLDADSVKTARQKLRASRVFPVSIAEVHDRPIKTKTGALSLQRLFDRVKPSHVAMFTRQMATLVEAGFPLVSAIDTLLPQIESHGFKKKLTRIKDSIVEGNTFAFALALYPGIFSPLYVNMVRAGEASGTLEIVLSQLAEITEKQLELKNRVQTAMVYPLLMTFVGAAVLFFLLNFVVPKITSIFADMDQALPVLTRLLITVSDFSKSFGWLVLLAFAALWLTMHKIKHLTKVRAKIDHLKLTLPLLGPFCKKLAVARFTRTLGSLLANGVTMLAALEIVKNIAGNSLIAAKIEKASQDVSKGLGLGVSLAEGQLFPHLAVQMIQVGEQSGMLENMLYKVADVFENEVETGILRMTALLEPIMILVMGVIVAIIVLAICLPIFEMNQLVM